MRPQFGQGDELEHEIILIYSLTLKYILFNIF